MHLIASDGVSEPTNRDLADRFLSACARVEKALARRYQREFRGLGEAVRHAQQERNRLAVRHRSELAALVDLRNAISHSDYLDGLPIATPRWETVRAIEKLAAQFENPPRIESYMTRDPQIAQLNDPLLNHLQAMSELGISQLPVYSHVEYVGLLTTNAVARWVGAHLDAAGDVLIEGSHVRDVLGFAEDHEVARFVSRTTTALKVCDLFAQEVQPPVVLVTEHGKSAEGLLGLVTPLDTPRILSDLSVTSG